MLTEEYSVNDKDSSFSATIITFRDAYGIREQILLTQSLLENYNTEMKIALIRAEPLFVISRLHYHAFKYNSCMYQSARV